MPADANCDQTIHHAYRGACEPTVEKCNADANFQSDSVPDRPIEVM